MEYTKDTKLEEVKENTCNLRGFLHYKAQNHTNFKHYSTIDRINNIMEQHSLYLSDGSKWNDPVDKRHLNPQENVKKHFAYSFCFSQSESVAMWMLYGGMEHQGAMIDFPKSIINKLLSADTIKLGYFANKKFVTISTIEKQNYTIELIDMLYKSDSAADPSFYDIKRSDMRTTVQKSIVDNLPEYCIKEYPWSYENEVRLIVTLNEAYESKLNLCVKISFENAPDINKLTKRIYRAPNSTGCYSYNNSSLNGAIEWNLCKDCKRKNWKAKLRIKHCARK